MLGGVGGLLVLESAGSSFAPCYDGNGNVIAYADLADGSKAADFEYGPFGERIVNSYLSDPCELALSDLAPRYSTKREDVETGMLYYGYRYFNSETGRWLSRDPIGENGGLNLYGMVGNDPVNFVDVLGLCPSGYEPATQAEIALMRRGGNSFQPYHQKGSFGGELTWLIDGVYSPSRSAIENNSYVKDCEPSGKICVKKIANRSKTEQGRMASPWRLHMARDAVSNYFSSNSGVSIWRREITTHYRSIDHWHFVEELECCYKGKSANRYAGIGVLQVLGDQYSSAITDVQLGKGKYFVDGVDFHLTVTPPSIGEFENPGPQGRDIPSPP